MKGDISQAPRFFQNARWFVKLRWFVALITFISIFIGQNFFNVSIKFEFLYVLAMILLFINILYSIIIKRIIKSKRDFTIQQLRLFLNIQVTVDLSLLTAIIHYSGGIENPIIVFYIFHMILSGILLPKIDSIIQATIALIMFIGLVISEYYKVIPHYTINNHLSGLFESEIKYLTASLTVFTATSYMIVYLTSFVTKKLRDHELELEKLNRELNEKDRIKNEYVLRLTHDIKGFVSALKSNHEVIKRKIYGEMNNKYIPFIDGTSEVLANLTNFIRDLLHLTRSKLTGEIEMEEIEIESMIQIATDEVSDFALQRNIQIQTDIKTNKKKLFVYILSIKELLINVLNNSIKYSDPNTEISIEVIDYNHKYVLISIRDQGVGIPENEIPKIFSEFFRASNVKKSYEGTGLGLAIVKQIANNHGGDVWIESEINKGTNFHIKLPV